MTESDASTEALDSLLSYNPHLSVSGLARPDTMPSQDSALLSNLDVEFHDSSAIGRMRNVRSLSLLTLAETDGSRLFLGINKRGLLGLHFGHWHRGKTDQSLELARLPYLKSQSPSQPDPD